MDRDESRGLSGFIATVIIFILLFGCSPGVRDASVQEERQDETTTAVSVPQQSPSGDASVSPSPGSPVKTALRSSLAPIPS